MTSSVLTPLLQTTQYLLGKLQEVNELGDGLEDEVKSIDRVSKQIKASLESKRNQGGIEEVDRQIRELNYEAEDVIATFISEVEEHRRRKTVGKLIHAAGHIAKLQNLAKRIERYQKEVEKTLATCKTYGIDKKAEHAGAAEELQRRRRDVEKDDVVGFDDDTTMLVKKLTQSEGNRQLDAVSIIGMGGLGKTTLARKIYNDSRVKGHFHCCVWLYVSQDSGTTVFSLEIGETPEVEDLGVEKLKEKLVKCLRGRKYLVVWDDIWKTEVWNEVKSAFPDDRNGSRILITSRIKKVASNASPTSNSHPYLLSVLDKDDSWKLLSKKVFRGGECPEDLEHLGKKIAEGCCGLPLSIVALGKLLAEEEKTSLTWKRYDGNENSYLFKCKDIMALSYIHLPERLKPCFLYFGVYPEKFEIPVRQLIQLWIAEDFMSQTSNRNYLESDAEKILEELINQSMVQVDSRRTDGGVKTCHIHDALRYFCISQSKEDEFLEVIKDCKLSLLNKSRRLSIEYIDTYLSSNPTRCSRSLFFLGRDASGFNSNLCKWVFENFKYLRVLSFLRVDLYSIPTMIENLIMLKYVRIESPNLTDIPASICNLVNLETLDMRGSTSLQRLPKGIWKMRSLRNLYVSGPVKLPNDWDRNFEPLQNLRVLSTVSLDPRAVRRIVKAKLIPGVRKLGIWFASDKSDSKVEDLLKDLHQLHCLQILKVINYQERPLPNLFPPTITKITLRQVCLQVGGCMSELGKLLNLSILKVQDCSLSSVLKVGADSFPRLESLKLENLTIKEWEQGKGAMPILNRLVFKELFELTKLPSTLSTTLQDVKVVRSNLELVTTLEELEKRLPFKLKVDPLKDNDFYRTTAVPTVPPVTSSTEAPHWIRWIQRFMVKILLCCARSRGAISTMHGSVSSAFTPKEEAMAIEIESLKSLYESQNVKVQEQFAKLQEQNERYQAQEQELAALKRMIMKGKQPSMGNNQEGDQPLNVEDDDNEINLFDSRAPEKATE